MQLTPQLEHLVDSNFAIGRYELEEGKELIPQIILLAGDDQGTFIAPLIVATEVETAEFAKTLPILVKRVWKQLLSERPGLKLTAVVVLVDTWIEVMATEELRKKKALGTFVPPSQKPGSTEVLLVQLVIDGEESIFTWSYVRAGKEIVFAEAWKESKNLPCIFKGLWPL